MKIVFLGSASCYPSPARGVSCTALQHDDGSVWIFDCGEGSQIQLQKSCIKPGKISKIFITHLHGDHLYGLPGLLCTLGNGLDPDKGKDTIIELYGPVGVRKFVQVTLGLSRSPLVFRLAIIEMEPRPDQFPEDWNEWPYENELLESPLPQESSYERKTFLDNCWNIFDSAYVKVEAVALKHRIPSFGFVVTEKTSVGKLDSKKLLDHGIKPGPIFGKLKGGKTVEFEGEILDPKNFLGPDIPGRKLAVLGDTCDSSELVTLVEQGQGLDLLVHEATMEGKLTEKCVQFGHSTPAMAVQVAAQCRSRSLALFHLSPRYKPLSLSNGDDDPDSAKIIQDEALAELETLGKSDITLIVAEDFTEITIPKKK